jgi:hypothetical protein
MKEETPRDQRQNQPRAQSLQRVEKQIAQIERVIEALLDGVDINKLTPKDRLTIATRFAALQQKAIALEHSIAAKQYETYDSMFIATIMRKMRGEEQANGDAIDSERPMIDSITPHNDL